MLLSYCRLLISTPTIKQDLLSSSVLPVFPVNRFYLFKPLHKGHWYSSIHQNSFDCITTRWFPYPHEHIRRNIISYVMKATGVVEAIIEVYGPSTTCHITSGKAIARVLRIMHLLDAALHTKQMESVYFLRSRATWKSRWGWSRITGSFARAHYDFDWLITVYSTNKYIQ